MRFSDRTQIQKAFPSSSRSVCSKPRQRFYQTDTLLMDALTNRIGAVYDFVRSSLNAESSAKPFTLCTFRQVLRAIPLLTTKSSNIINPDEPPAKAYPETTPPLPPSFVAQQRKVPNHLRKPPPPDPSKMSLMELQLVPQSVLLVRFEEDELNRMSRV